ncbi:hypothetical protein BDB01DRAFT_777830 [Pilobolus umbonatus]|nr:hypothetical protein BDB01DRAFT_777830 [Pilobolus umbonatus]
MALFIGRIPRDMNNRDLEETFSKYGKITRLDLKKGFGFVEFDDKRDAEDAIKGITDKGELVVEWAKNGGKRPGENECFHCGKEGHWARDCQESGRNGREGGRGGFNRRDRSPRRDGGRGSDRDRRDRGYDRRRDDRGGRERSPRRGGEFRRDFERRDDRREERRDDRRDDRRGGRREEYSRDDRSARRDEIHLSEKDQD